MALRAVSPHERGWFRRLGWVSSDEFSLRYSDLVTGSYDCVDRIVLNAFFPLGHNPGGFRTWWRRWQRTPRGGHVHIASGFYIQLGLAFFGRWLLYICVKFQAAGLRRARAM